MAISFLLTILILFSVNALEASISAPSSVRQYDSFPVSISINSSSAYDIKLFVHNSSDSKITRGEIISLVFSGNWKDSWNYLLAAYPSQTSFLLNVTESSGQRELCLQVRHPNASSYLSKSCQPLFVEAVSQPLSQSSSTQQASSNSDNKSIKKNTNKPSSSASSSSNKSSHSSQSLPSPSEPLSQITGKIVLNKPPSSAQKQIVYTSAGKQQLWLAAAFATVCLFILILILLGKL